MSSLRGVVNAATMMAALAWQPLSRKWAPSGRQKRCTCRRFPPLPPPAATLRVSRGRRAASQGSEHGLFGGGRRSAPRRAGEHLRVGATLECNATNLELGVLTTVLSISSTYVGSRSRPARGSCCWSEPQQAARRARSFGVRRWRCRRANPIRSRIRLERCASNFRGCRSACACALDIRAAGSCGTSTRGCA